LDPAFSNPFMPSVCPTNSGKPVFRSNPTGGHGSGHLQGKTLPLGFRADILVGNTILVEIKAVVALLPTHDAQILTYLRMSQIPVGLLMNFHAIRLKDGLRRFVI
jgi:PD-(D/E)XK nuclease superfamily